MSHLHSSNPLEEVRPAEVCANPRRAIVIGAGFGGLAAALRLRARGYEVRVIDRLDRPGGRATSFDRKGFVFDSGPTIITAPFLFEELFELFDRRLSDYVELRPIKPWYRIRFADGDSFDYGGEMDEMLEEIRRFEPRDADGYLRFLDRTRDIYRVGFEELGDQPFSNLWSMIRLLPKLIRLQSFLSVFRRTAGYIKNPKLRQVFSFHPLLVGGNPFTTTSIYSLIHYLERKHGVFFAMGGTGALVDGLVRLAKENGVLFELGQTVDEILVEGDRAAGVRLEDGRVMRADVTVANADAPAVYRNLLRSHRRKRWTDRRIKRQKYSMGLFVLYFGTTKTYPHLAHHEILLGPRYRGLIQEIFEGDKLAEDFSLYLHVPTRTDSSLAPPGCESMYALVPVPNLRADIDWEVEGPRLRDRVVRFLDETVCPGLQEHIVEDSFVTPLHFRDNLLSLEGAGFSIQPLLRQSAFFRFHNRSEELRDLFLVGSGTHPGAGLPGVLSSAKVLERVLEDPAPARYQGTSTEENVSARFGAVMAERAKTFHAAARLLPRSTRRDFQALYAFCRFVDDLADRASDRDQAAAALDRVDFDLERGESAVPETSALLALASRHQIPVRYARQLVAGVRSDLGRVRIETPDELLRYSYRVASTVGVMLCHVLDVEDPEAHRFAVDLGLGMQLTNIARDVAEDFDAGRIYLPSRWLSGKTLAAAIAGEASARGEFAAALGRLLRLADSYYDSAENGMGFLPARARWAILTAARAYRAIGERLLQSSDLGLVDRAIVSPGRKLSLAVGSALALMTNRRFKSVPPRPVHQAALHEPIEDLIAGDAEEGLRVVA